MRHAILSALMLFAFSTTSAVEQRLDREGNLIRVKHPKTESPIMCIGALLPEHGLSDPHVWIERGRLYMFGGHDKTWLEEADWTMDRWEIWSSDDLYDWQYESKILPSQTYIGDEDKCWAGDIVERNGKYYWYFSCRKESTGVVVADKITGPYVDVLKRPLLPQGIVPHHPYDPEIFIEDDGRYYILFGAGQYYLSELGDDMISLKSEPTPIAVQNKQGQRVEVSDKSTLFKRRGLYYLVWGGKYAISKELYGPYEFKGQFIAGGHGSIFKWRGDWYALQVNKELSQFFRGISLKPLNFHENGDVKIPEGDYMYPGDKRHWEFENSAMGWRGVNATSVEWCAKSGTIAGCIDGEGAAIQSCVWLLNPVNRLSKMRVRLKNESAAKSMRISVSAFKSVAGNFWRDPSIDWASQWSKVVEIEPNSDDFITYTIDVNSVEPQLNTLKALRIEPALGVGSGRWEIDSIVFE